MDMLSVNDHSSMLLQFLYKLYQDQVLCDFEVIGYDGTSLWGHRLVLMASSKYIYNICMKNSDAKSLVLNINTDVLQMLLEFCYTGQLYVSPDNYKNVEEGAAFLQMTAAIESLTHQITEDVIRNTGIKDQSMYKTDRSLGFNEVIIKVEESTIFDSEQSSDKHLNLACSDIKQTTNSRNKHFKTNYSSKNTSSSNRSRSCTKGQGHMRSEGQGQTEEQNDQDIDTNIQYTTITARRSLRGFNSLKKSNKLQSREKKQHGKNSEQIKNKKSPKDKETSKTVNDKTVQRETKCTGAEPMCQNDKRSRLNIQVPKLLNRFCTHCNKSFTSVAKLQYHVTYYHPSYVCSNFRRVYIVKKCVKDSILRKKFTKQTDKLKCHLCKLCGKTFSKYSILSHHYLKDHRSSSKFANNWFGFCRLKMALCKIIVPLAKNRRNRLESIEKSSSPEKSVCYICEKQFSTLKTLNRHLMRIHQEGALGRRKKGKKKESLLICIICQKSFSRPDVLCAHLMLEYSENSRSFPTQLGVDCSLSHGIIFYTNFISATTVGIYVYLKLYSCL
ncbi:BTB And C-terminal Kelch [Mactra antiquata]